MSRDPSCAERSLAARGSSAGRPQDNTYRRPKSPRSCSVGLCPWLEELRYSYNTLYCLQPGEDYETTKNVEPIIINSGYRSPAVNKLAGGAKTSNHLSGCAVDIRCAGKEQMIRYASILLDIADGTKQDYDELLLEQHGNVCWLHFAVRPKDNRRKIEFLKS